MADLPDHMRRNPAADWTISDVVRVCMADDADCVAPTGGGSHFKVFALVGRTS